MGRGAHLKSFTSLSCSVGLGRAKVADAQKTAIRTAAENRILLASRSDKLGCGVHQILNKSEYVDERRTVERGTKEPEEP